MNKFMKIKKPKQIGPKAMKWQAMITKKIPPMSHAFLSTSACNLEHY
jgi:hypothetical protein